MLGRMGVCDSLNYPHAKFFTCLSHLGIPLLWSLLSPRQPSLNPVRVRDWSSGLEQLSQSVSSSVLQK